MATRKQKTTEVQPGIPSELYWAIEAAQEQPHRTTSSRAHHQWHLQMRAAGFTVRTLVQTAMTDPGYQRWRELQERKQRLLAEDPGPTPGPQRARVTHV